MANILGGTPLSTPFYGNSKAFNNMYNADPVGTMKRIAEEQAREAATRKAIVTNAVKIGHENGMESDPTIEVGSNIAADREISAAKIYDTMSDLYANKGSANVKTDTDSKSGIADWFKGARDTVTGATGKVGDWLGNSTSIAGRDISNKLIAGVGAGTLAAAGTVVGGGVSGRGPLRRLAMGSAAKRRAARSYFKDSRNAAALADEYKKDGNITKANKLLDKSLRRNRSGEEMIRAADAIDRREISKLEKKLSDGRISDVKRYKLERKLEDRKSRLLHSND